MGIESVVDGYLKAKWILIDSGWHEEIQWAEDLQNVRPDTLYVLREYAWVVLNSGFRAKVARKLWPSLQLAFHDFQLDLITEDCLSSALKVINHPGKMGAIIKTAAIIRAEGIEGILDDAHTPEKLTRLPWIGKITCWHLAKLLGVDAVKPDVHLQRAAKATGHDDPLTLAQDLKDATGDALTVVDSVLWRYGEQKVAQKWPDWPELFGVEQ